MTTQDNVLYLSLTLGRPGIKRKIGADRVQVDADKSLITVSKEILDSKAYREILSADGQIRSWVRARSLPVPALKTGIYAVPVSLVTQVERRLEKMAANRRALVADFIREYPARVEDARTRLRSNFNRSDYPSASEMEDAFKFTTRYVSFDVPASLEEVNSDMFAREREKAAKAWEETLAEWKTLLRNSMADLVNHAVERLAAGKKGKTKIFRNSLIENVREFLKTFDARNVADDAELKQIVQKARDLLKNGVTPQRIRDDGECREAVRAGFTEIKKTLDGMIVDRPVRKIVFDDENS